MACGAEVHGAFDGSPDLRFVPGRAGGRRVPLRHRHAPGAATLVLQTVLPILATAAAPSRVEVIGGTHVPAQPQPTTSWRGTGRRSSGGSACVRRSRSSGAGFYPRGGGEVRAEVAPVGAAGRPSTSRGAGALVAVRGHRGRRRGVRGDVARRAADAARALALGGSAGWRPSGRWSELARRVAGGVPAGRGRVRERARGVRAAGRSAGCGPRCWGSARRGELLRFLERRGGRGRPVARRPAGRAAGARRGRGPARHLGGDVAPRDGGRRSCAASAFDARDLGPPRRAGRPRGGSRA